MTKILSADKGFLNVAVCVARSPATAAGREAELVCSRSTVV